MLYSGYIFVDVVELTKTKVKIKKKTIRQCCQPNRKCKCHEGNGSLWFVFVAKKSNLHNMIIICFPDFSEEVQRKLITTLYKYGYAKLLQKFYHQKRVFSDGDLHHKPWITKDQYPEYLRKENLNLEVNVLLKSKYIEKYSSFDNVSTKLLEKVLVLLVYESNKPLWDLQLSSMPCLSK